MLRKFLPKETGDLRIMLGNVKDEDNTPKRELQPAHQVVFANMATYWSEFCLYDGLSHGSKKFYLVDQSIDSQYFCLKESAQYLDRIYSTCNKLSGRCISFLDSSESESKMEKIFKPGSLDIAEMSHWEIA